MHDPVAEVHKALADITGAWRQNHPEAMFEHLHPDIAMVFPGFQGSIRGRETLIGSFKEFCTNARVVEYEEDDERIDVVGGVAVASFRFSMIYERAEYREKSTGRDVWIFEKDANGWTAVWRTMTDLKEERDRHS